jgi:hypothetical protein
VAEVARKSTGKNLLEARFICFFASKLTGEFFECGLGAQASSHSAPISTPLNAVEVTTFSHGIVCRSPQRKDSKMDCSLGEFATLPPVDSLVNSLSGCKLRQRRDLRFQKGNEGSNRTRSAIQSELHTICARSAPKYANNARISRLFTSKPDFRERTARRRRGHRPAFSPECTYAVGFNKGVKRMQCDQKPMAAGLVECEATEKQCPASILRMAC